MFVSHRVSSDLICGALCVYLLLGSLWALAYSVFSYLDPTSFAFVLAEDGEAELMRFGGERAIIAIYYSLVTMSTLGYGDIVPTSSLTHMCAVLSFLLGSAFMQPGWRELAHKSAEYRRS